MSQHPDRLTAAFDQVKKDIRMLTNPKTYENLTQNQIIGGLTMLLLVVGAITGIYLGQEGQDLRQQAAIYDVCVRGDAVCDGKTNGSSCGLGTCRLNEANGECQCIHPTNTPTLGCDVGEEYLNLATCMAGCGQGGTCTQRSGGYCCDPGPTFTPACFGAGVACGNGAQGQLPNANCCPGLSCVIEPDNVARCVAGATTRPSNTPVPTGAQCLPGQEFLNASTCNAVCSGPCTPGGIGYCCNPAPTTRPSNTPVPTGAQCLPGQEFLNASTCNAVCSGPCTPGGIGYCCNPVDPTNTPIVVGPTTRPSSTPTSSPVPPTNTPGGPTNTPVPPTEVPPTNTPVIGPICTSVTVNSPNTPAGSPIAEGQQVTLTCATVAGATSYQFRMVRPPNNTIDSILASTTTPNVSVQYLIRSGGRHIAQCIACNTNGCSPWGAIGN